MPEFTCMIKDRSHLNEATEVAESRLPDWAASFTKEQRFVLYSGQIFVYTLY